MNAPLIREDAVFIVPPLGYEKPGKLRATDWEQSHTDPCLIRLCVLMCVYVDDVMYVGKKDHIDKVVTQFRAQ